ncbi:MAG: trigger factor [Bacillota bacterium]
MDVVNKEKEGNTVTLDIKVEKDKVNEALQSAYKKVVKEVEIPGFRKGRVPRKVLEARYGEEILYKDALDIIIPEAYQKAIEEEDLEPIDQPEIDDYYIAKDEPATFTAVVEVKPEVELGEYTGFDVESEQVEISEEEIDEYLTSIQERNSQLENTDKTFVQDGDYVIMDFEGTIDGEAFPGGSGEEYGLEIGSGNFIPGFEAELIGHKVGEEFEFDITFPEDYQADDLAGETATFQVDIKEIKQKVVPELDDEFAKDVSEFDTLEEYKEEIKSRMKQDKRNQSDSQFQQELLEKISENTSIDIPEIMIEDELNNMYRNFAMQISQQGMSIDDYFEQTGMDEESWKEQNYEAAANRVRNNLILEAISDKEEIEVNDEDIEDKIKEFADRFDQEPEQLKEQLKKTGRIEGLKSDIKLEKTIDFLKENNMKEVEDEDETEDETNKETEEK